MQTFLPFPNFAVSAMVLDWRRLGKQRVEAHQLVRAIQPGYVGGWSNHPAALMWRGHDGALKFYADVMCREWERRGYENNYAPFFPEDIDKTAFINMPMWLGDEAFHAAHRSRLLMKDPDWYGQFGWAEEPGREYIWPVSKETT